MSEKASDKLDRIVASCEQAWRAGKRPDIEEVLRSNPECDQQRLRTELVHLELEQRLSAGEPVRVEEYLERYPDLTADRQVVLGLIRSEFEMRRRQEPRLETGEYAERFPWCRNLLPTELASSPRPRPGRVAVRLNCPHCQNPIEIVDDRQNAEDVICPSCGSSFHLAEDRTHTWKPEKLPRIGKFELLEVVGRGAFGTVYRAHDSELDRIVAVKLPRSGSLSTPDDEDRFIREARSVAQLRHANIVPVYETGRSEQFPYIVSAFVEGVTLSDSLTGTRPGFRESAALIAKVAEALQYAHDQGVIHRDVKPSNIMLDDAGQPHLMDFGLARRDAGEITMTLEGQVLGTPAYMSPEQARGEGHRVDGRSDVYSLGVILFELLTGELPFRGNTRMLLHQVLKDEPRSPRSLNDRIPRDLETICLKAMAKEPGRRYQSAQALADDLTRYLAGEPITARPVGRVERVWRWAKRNRGVATLGAAVVLLLTTIAIGSTVAALRIAIARNEASATARREQVARQQAESAEAREANERREAERLRVEAEKSRAEAVDSAAVVTRQRDLATEQEKRARQAELDARRNFYFAEINAAQQAWNSGNVAQALDVLGHLTPTAGESDFRDFEYYRLWKLSHQNILTLDSGLAGVSSIALSKDEKLLVAGYRNGTLRVWDLATQRLLHSVKAHKSYVVSVSIAPDNETIASSGFGEVTLRDIKAIELPRHRFEMSAESWGLSFSPDGRLLAAASTSGLIKLWSVQTLEEDSSFSLRDDGPLAVIGTSGAWSMAFSPDGSQLAAAGGILVGTGVVALWDVPNKQLTRRLSGHKAVILSLAYSPDGSRLVTGSADQTIILWDVKEGAKIASMEGHRGSITALAFAPDGKQCFSGSTDRTIRVWDVDTRQQRSTLRAHTDVVRGILFADKGKKLITCSSDSTIRVWDPTLRPDYQTISVRQAGAKSNIGSSSLIALGGIMGSELQLVTDVAVSPDHEHLAAITADGRFRGVVQVADRATHQLRALSDLQHADASYFCGRFSPDGMRYAAGTGSIIALFGSKSAVRSHRVVLWNVNTGEVTHRLSEHQSPFFDLDFSASGNQLAGAATDGSVFVWNTTTGRLVWQLQSAKRPIFAVKFSPDESILASAGLDGVVRFWDLSSGKEVHQLRSPAPFSLAFSPQGDLLAVGGGTAFSDVHQAYGDVMVWDWRNNKLLRTLGGHVQFVRRVFFSLDGSRLWSVGFDGTVKLWDVKTGYQAASLEGDWRYCFSADLQVDGTTLVVGTEQGDLRIWDTSIDLKSVVAWHEQQARTAENNELWSEALHQLDQIDYQRGGSASVMLWRGRILLQKGEREAAFRELEQGMATATTSETVAVLSTDFRSKIVRKARLAFESPGQTDVAIKLLYDLLDVADKLLQGNELELALTYYEVAEELGDRGRLDEALERFSVARRLLRQRDNPESLAQLALACRRPAAFLYDANRMKEAVLLYAEGAEAWQRLKQLRPLVPGEMYFFGNCLRFQGHAHFRSRAYDEAISAFKKSIAVFEELLKSDPKNSASLDELTKAIGGLIESCKLAAGNDPRVIEEAEEAIEFLGSIALQVKDSDQLQNGRAWMYDSLSNVHKEKGRADDAIEAVTKGIKILQSLVANHPENVKNKVDLAGLTCNRGTRHSRAEHNVRRAAFEEAIAILEQALAQDPAHEYGMRYLAINSDNLTQELLVAGEFDAGRRVGVNVAKKVAKAEHWQTLYLAAFLGSLFPDRGVEPTQMIKLAEQASKMSPQAPFAWRALGLANLRTARHSDAVTALDKAIKLWKDDDSRAWLLVLRALALAGKGDLQMARVQRDEAIALAEKMSNEKTDMGEPKMSEVHRAFLQLFERELNLALKEEAAPAASP